VKSAVGRRPRAQGLRLSGHTTTQPSSIEEEGFQRSGVIRWRASTSLLSYILLMSQHSVVVSLFANDAHAQRARALVSRQGAISRRD